MEIDMRKMNKNWMELEKKARNRCGLSEERLRISATVFHGLHYEILSVRQPAYRLEPLILKYYSTIQPALIHRVDAVSKPCYDTLPLLEYSGKEFKHPKPQNCHQQVAKNPCSDTNQLITTQDADSSRRSSIASELIRKNNNWTMNNFGFYILFISKLEILL
ncbi:unnamed protein product [Schistosoma curassoni]|uniref:DUF3715 domain-containing protein n=1 Tax=Schistosoma curassoni TaxID=6186 RepID=A0A183L1J4_9TREM|nr:unnamed protein product [Schistosoma curassoni]